MNKVTKNITLYGHILDSLTLPKVLDTILEMGGDYQNKEIAIGKSRLDFSSASIEVQAESQEKLEPILQRLLQLGVKLEEDEEVRLAEAGQDGVFPEGFYCTTNLPTRILHQGNWISVSPLRMDCGIELDKSTQKAKCVKMMDVKAGRLYVVGSQGIRTTLPDGGQRQGFGFMNSQVSAEKPYGVMIKDLSLEMKAIRSQGGKIVLVAGPAVVHTGAREALANLIEAGYVSCLLTGNALAAHDIEASFFGTSLGVSLKQGRAVPQGNQNHLHSINRIRGLGGIRAAVERDVLKDGVMHQCIVSGCEFVLAGSIRDDGPLPEVITDVLEAQKAMRDKLEDAKLVIMLSTMLHSIAVGNLLPADIPLVAVDISPAVVTKLSDRGSQQARGVVMNVESFLRQLCDYLGC